MSIPWFIWHDSLWGLIVGLWLHKINLFHISFSSFLKQTTGAASYSKFVSREMSKAEALLKVYDHIMSTFCWVWFYSLIMIIILKKSYWSLHKFTIQVILSPFDSVADTYRALLPEGTPMEFQRILELKVVVYSCYLI